MALEMTTPPAPAMPCRRRKKRNPPMPGAKRQPTVEIKNNAKETSNGFLRP